jgi:putative holliday junction resolvase
MPVVSLIDFPASGPLLGLDPGSTAIGVAVSDPSRLIASPLETITRGKRLGPVLDRLFDLYDARACVGVVLGLPINMDGTHGPRAQSARSFAGHIVDRRDVPVALWDERLSTAAVERALLAVDASRKRRDELVDKLAAAWILQGAIDRLAQGQH